MSQPDLKVMKILLIDDEQFIRSTIRQILVHIGISHANIHEADSVDAGMAQTLRIRPMLVFCDVHMPSEGGLKYLEKLRKVSPAEIADTPVVMLTSDASEKVVVTAKTLKADGYLVKPVSLTAVKRALDFALRPASAPRAEDKTPKLIIEGKPDDLRMISDLIRKLYTVEIIECL